MTGAAGQVGTELRTLLPDAIALSHADLDVTDAAAVRDACRGTEVVVHLAAFTDVDGCEREPARAMGVNADGAHHVADAAHAIGARLVYVSTDYIFDGTKGDAYVETDEPNPLNVYGRSKLVAESYVSEPRDAVVRTSWVLGRGRNFARTIAAAARENGTVKVVDDQRGRPTVAADLAEALAFVIEEEITGAVHVAGDGPPGSWAELAGHVIDVAGIDADVVRVSTEEYRRLARGLVAPRPPDSTLSLERARSLGIPLADWRASIERHLKEIA